MTISNTYDTIKFNNNFIYIIANANVLLSELISEVNSSLIKQQFQGTIVFDMLIVNGNNKRRFFQSFANNDDIKFKNVELMEFVPAEIVTISNNYLKNHIDILSQGALSKFEIEKIKDLLTN